MNHLRLSLLSFFVVLVSTISTANAQRLHVDYYGQLLENGRPVSGERQLEVTVLSNNRTYVLTWEPPQRTRIVQGFYHLAWDMGVWSLGYDPWWIKIGDQSDETIPLVEFPKSSRWETKTGDDYFLSFEERGLQKLIGPLPIRPGTPTGFSRRVYTSRGEPICLEFVVQGNTLHYIAMNERWGSTNLERFVWWSLPSGRYRYVWNPWPRFVPPVTADSSQRTLHYVLQLTDDDLVVDEIKVILFP